MKEQLDPVKKTIVIDLTNRCNLNCTHCFNARHSADSNLDIRVLDNILSHAPEIKYLSFTGGEPTLHPEFEDIVSFVSRAGCSFGIASNGWNFPDVYRMLMPFRENFIGMTFSLDGACDSTHDRVRGSGSFRRVMQAVSVCVMKDISFTFNTLITRNNVSELRDIADLAAKLGARGIRYGHLIPTSLSIKKSLCLDPDERVDTDTVIRGFKDTVPLPVIMAPGHYTRDPFPCSALHNKEIDIDWEGNMTVCCHLTGHDTAGSAHIAGNLKEMSFAEACSNLAGLLQGFRDEKQGRLSSEGLRSSDYFPCWYCANYFDKVDWLKAFPENPWTGLVWRK